MANTPELLDDICEQAEAVRAAAQPDIIRLRRYCTQTVRGHDDWEAAGLLSWASSEMDEAVQAAIDAKTIEEALAHLARCRAAAESIEEVQP